VKWEGWYCRIFW